MTVSAPQLGKTLTAALWLLAGAWADGGRVPWPSWWLGPTYEQAKHGFLNHLVPYARTAGILADHTTTTPLKATLTNGSVIEARSWESPEGLYGPTVARIAPDEFGYMTDPAWLAITSRVRESVLRGLGYIRMAGNVGEVGGKAEELYQLALRGELPGARCRTWTWRDRAEAAACSCGDHGTALPISLELKEIAQHRPECERGLYLQDLAALRSTISAAQFRQLYDAEWLDWSALPVYSFERAVHVTEDAERQPSLPIELSCDFNVDPMSWVIGQHKGREIWDFDEIVIDGGVTTTDACQEFLRRFPDRKTEVVVYGDASGNSKTTKSKLSDYQLIQQQLGAHYHRFSLQVPAANPAIKTRTNAVNAKLRSASGDVTYFTHPRCRRLIEDRVKRSWKKGTSEFDTRDRRRGHSSDAGDYRIVRLFPVEIVSQQRVSVGRPGHSAANPLAGMRF